MVQEKDQAPKAPKSRGRRRHQAHLLKREIYHSNTPRTNQLCPQV